MLRVSLASFMKQIERCARRHVHKYYINVYRHMSKIKTEMYIWDLSGSLTLFFVYAIIAGHNERNRGTHRGNGKRAFN